MLLTTSFSRIFLISFLLFSSTATAATDVRIWIPGWLATESLATKRASAAVVEHNGVIYAIGGIDGRDFLASSEFSQIQPSGQLAKWQAGSSLNEPRGFFDAVAYNGYIYVVGGGNGPSGHNLLRSIERAAILADGSLGPWEIEPTQLNLPRRCVKLVLVGKRIYAFGGFGGTLLDSIESAEIQDNGHLGPWRIEANTLTMPRYVHAGKKTEHAIIITGGHPAQGGEGLTSVEWAKLDKNAPSLSWQATHSLNTGRYGHSAIQLGDFVYVLGGLERMNYIRSIEKSQVDTQSGEPRPWQETNPLSVALANFGIVTYKNFVYVIGGTNQDGYYNNVEFTSANARGDLGFWGNKQQARDYESWENPMRGTANASPLALQGVVKESLAAGSYVYLRVANANGEEWIAAETGDYALNSYIEYDTGIMMHNFHSQVLKRDFAQIRFVSKVNQYRGSPH